MRTNADGLPFLDWSNSSSSSSSSSWPSNSSMRHREFGDQAVLSWCNRNTTEPLHAISKCFSMYSFVELEHLACELRSTTKFYHGWLGAPAALIALTLALIYLVAVWKAIAQYRVSRKCYVLLLNRTLGDITACVLTLAISCYILSSERPMREPVQFLDAFVIGSFWAAMTSYVALSWLKLYAIARPLHYRNKVTMRRCIHLIVLSWVVFLLMSLYALISLALIKVPALKAWSGCRPEICLLPMYRIRNCLVVVVYLLTLACFIATVLLIRRAERVGAVHQRRSTYPWSVRIEGENESSTNGIGGTVGNQPQARPPRFRFPLWKLALNVSTFALLNLFYAGWAAWILLHSYFERCYFARHLVAMWTCLGLVRFSLMVRIIMDPLLAFITDFQVRRSVLSMFNLLDTRLPFGLGIPSGSVAGKGSSNTENSSEDLPHTPATTAQISYYTSSNGRAIPINLRREAKLSTTSNNTEGSSKNKVHPTEKRRAATERRNRRE